MKILTLIRILTGLALLLALVSASPAAETHGTSSKRKAAKHHPQRTPVSVQYTYLGVSDESAWRQEDECLAPLTMLEHWGWRITTLPNHRIRIEVEDQQAEISIRSAEGQDCIFLREAIRLLDGNSVWSAPDRLQITSRVRVVKFSSHHLRVSSSLAVLPKVVQPDSTHIAHLVLEGAVLSQDAILDVEPNVNAANSDIGTVRIDFPAAMRFMVAPEAIQPGKELDIDSGTPAQEDNASIAFTHQTERGLTITLNGRRQTFGLIRVHRTGPQSFDLTLPRVHLSEAPATTSPTISSVQVKDSDFGSTLSITLSKPQGVIVSQPAGSLQLYFVAPSAAAPLSGKLLVVDAGHGGKDSGARHDYSGLREKELTLPIARYLAADLASEGAFVILSRDSDEFITLDDRAAIANINRADLFLCVHINSNGEDTKTSGSITFFHGDNSTSHELARSIQRELAKASDIPSIGCWSDYKIYMNKGFSVLRNTKMPGVLMELGFINNNHDRSRLVDDSVQQADAAAAARGVENFLGVNHAQN